MKRSTASPVKGSTSVPRHDSELRSLARIEGQIRGIRAMVEEGRYCVDILTQTRAVHAALRQVERNVLRGHLQSCVVQAFHGGSKRDREDKIGEILSLFNWDGDKLSG